ncbi:alpha-amylase family protein [Saccharothrix luteola]|uniref:alpha-amylase family protein n=1 Tax=Saccharothrix luteola TaxID=2893018 RepID=UPI001E3B8396|nr:alpha-amylase family protein [Saccharothrix luteola]MCC8246007.1 alpha-amylase family protein [Saccharothrix luteola]
MKLTRTADLWWKNAVVYCLDVETFHDSNGDGHGDFRGLIDKIDHLHQLGVTCVWLMPFFPTPDRDDGYDITDFYGVDPRLGTLGDFVEFVRTARDRGMRVIADLVVNHTSDQHPWFQAARDRESPFHDWYVWADEPPADAGEGVVFPDKEKSLWTYDRKAKRYYLHRFYRHQPDLNVANPAVRDEIARVMGFWMELGLSGFRVDAVPFLLEAPIEALPDPHDYLADLRAFLSRRNGEAILLGEVNLPYTEAMAFFGGADGVGDELHMCFDFVGMQQMYLSLARGDASPLTHALKERPEPPRDCHWATFVRNHDELTLDKLTEPERQEVFAAFGPEEDMQLYGRGLRRRLPSMLEGDLGRIKMVYSLLFSLPGTPVLFYGEEVGMTEDLSLEGRLAVRTPMWWDAVDGQRRDPESLLGWTRLLVERYRECPELAWGSFSTIDTADPAVFAHRCEIDGGTVIAVHNFADRDVVVQVPKVEGVLTDLLVDGTVTPKKDGTATVELGPYGCRWFRQVSR